MVYGSRLVYDDKILTVPVVLRFVLQLTLLSADDMA